MANRINPLPIEREIATAKERRDDRIGSYLSGVDRCVDSIMLKDVLNTVKDVRKESRIYRKSTQFEGVKEELQEIVSKNRGRYVNSGVAHTPLRASVETALRTSNGIGMWKGPIENDELVSGWRVKAAKTGKPSYGDCVYFVEGGGLHKIGRSIDLNSRMISHRCSSPVPLRVNRTIVCIGGKQSGVLVERVIHGAFASKRKHGEWFDLSSEDFEYLDISCHPWLVKFPEDNYHIPGGAV